MSKLCLILRVWYASPAAHPHARIAVGARARVRAHHRRRTVRARNAHRRRLMCTRAVPTTCGACTRVQSRLEGVVAAYLARLANLRCSRSLRRRGASADGSSARGPARGPCRRIDWRFLHGSCPPRRSTCGQSDGSQHLLI